jgi:hypothetical protein
MMCCDGDQCAAQAEMRPRSWCQTQSWRQRRYAGLSMCLSLSLCTSASLDHAQRARFICVGSDDGCRYQATVAKEIKQFGEQLRLARVGLDSARRVEQVLFEIRKQKREK